VAISVAIIFLIKNNNRPAATEQERLWRGAWRQGQ
jgi:hypothetical protein